MKGNNNWLRLAVIVTVTLCGCVDLGGTLVQASDNSIPVVSTDGQVSLSHLGSPFEDMGMQLVGLEGMIENRSASAIEVDLSQTSLDGADHSVRLTKWSASELRRVGDGIHQPVVVPADTTVPFMILFESDPRFSRRQFIRSLKKSTFTFRPCCLRRDGKPMDLVPDSITFVHR